jgi:hypothetical protein
VRLEILRRGTEDDRKNIKKIRRD